MFDPERSRCAATGSRGRCQLRGSIGHGNAAGGYWLCAWHDAVLNLGEPCCLENFTEFIKEQKEYGCARWDHRSIIEWWTLIQGDKGIGCWDWRKIEETPLPEYNTEENDTEYDR